MAQYGFGSGVLFGTRTDTVNATPVQFGAVQDVSIDFQFSLKELHGQFQFPLAIARGAGKISGKAKMARISGRSFNDLFFGTTLASGQQATAFQEAAAVPAAPFQVTVANAASFIADLGVANAATGLPLLKVAAAPATGQYSVNAGTGVYSFAAADTGMALLISYGYAIAGSGQTMVIGNQLLGAQPQFQANFYETFQGKQLNLQLNACVSTKLTLASKLEDFTIPEIDFMAFADAAGNLGSISLAEAS